MNDDEVIKSVMLLTLGKHLRGETLTQAERATYNDLIRAGRALSPVHIRCKTHGNDILIYDPDEDIGPNFRRHGDNAICVQCGPRELGAVTLHTVVNI